MGYEIGWEMVFFRKVELGVFLILCIIFLSFVVMVVIVGLEYRYGIYACYVNRVIDA